LQAVFEFGRAIVHPSNREDTAVGILYELTGIQPADENNVEVAKDIYQLIEGLPLAMAHMSPFIKDQGYSYKRFLALYQKHAKRISVKDQSC
jgi:hypothetical protein